MDIAFREHLRQAISRAAQLDRMDRDRLPFDRRAGSPTAVRQVPRSPRTGSWG
jgi:hypothetical protein